MKNSTILDHLNQIAGGDSIPMHMPGHKRNTALAPYLKTLGAQLDVTEITGADCLHHPDGIIKNAMDRAKSLYHSRESFLLVNGSTCGILAAIHATTLPGDEILMARSCHKSVYNGVALCGLNTHYLTQQQHQEGYSCPVTPDEVARGLAEYPEAKLIIITSPTYEGYLCDIKAIAALCHKSGKILLVDEAHGAHLDFCDYFTGSALTLGADIVIQSLHKTLPSLTQTAIAHIQGNRVDSQAFSSSLAIFETSSPSYLLMASIDGCLKLLEERGEILFTQWQENLQNFYDKTQNLKNISVIYESSQVKDPSKILISTRQANIDGTGLMAILREKYNIELEMAYGDYALAMTGLGEQNLDALATALLDMDSKLTSSVNQLENYSLPGLPEIAIPVCQTRRLPVKYSQIQQAQGCISASYLWAYPPGVPLIVPGEIFDGTLIKLLQTLELQGVEIQDSRNCWSKQIAIFDDPTT